MDHSGIDRETKSLRRGWSSMPPYRAASGDRGLIFITMAMVNTQHRQVGGLCWLYFACCSYFQSYLFRRY